jgi:hypothetical protein
MKSSADRLGSWIINAALYIPIGIVVTIIFLTIIMAGDFSTALTLLFFSIICTAGISLILWLPLWYGVGYLGAALFRLLLRAIEGQSSTPPQQSPAPAAPTGEPGQGLSRDQVAVFNYIKKAKAKGLNREFISKALQANGWTAESINQGFQLVEQGA